MDGFIKLADDSPLEEMKGNYLHISKKRRKKLWKGRRQENQADEKMQSVRNRKRNILSVLLNNKWERRKWNRSVKEKRIWKRLKMEERKNISLIGFYGLSSHLFFLDNNDFLVLIINTYQGREKVDLYIPQGYLRVMNITNRTRIRNRISG